MDETIKHLAKFVSDIWQIHPFSEGNTRATAVFIIKYMKTLGLKVDNDAFKKHSWYLELFFSNLLMGTECELKNRYMHVNYAQELDDMKSQSIISKVPKVQNDTLECTLEERAVIKLISENPVITQKELVVATGKSISTVKRVMSSL